MYGDSQALYSDGESIFPQSSDAKEAPFAKRNRELFMDSEWDANSTYSSEYNKHYGTSNQNSSGLLRFRSTPGSLFENFTDGVGKGVKNNAEIQQNPGLTSRFNSSSGAHGNQVSQSVNGYSVNSQILSPYPSSSGGTTQMESGGYRIPNSIGVENQGQYKIGSNLMRQNSSPAELFSHLSAQSGYAKMRRVRRYRLGSGESEHLSPTSNMSKGPMNFSSGIHSTLGMLSRISELENETGGNGGANDEKLGTRNGDSQYYGSEFPYGSWNNPTSKFTETFTGLKREIDDDHSLFSDYQGGEPRNQAHLLSHHLSLPKTSAEIAAMEKLFQFSDTVPCKIRAKRGCATHPRSIAERVRRTRISERMRKLQELVPNMDKQTNTAGMLDLAVDYIKDLQKQYKTLSDIRANCKCTAMKQAFPDEMI